MTNLIFQLTLLALQLANGSGAGFIIAHCGMVALAILWVVRESRT